MTQDKTTFISFEKKDGKFVAFLSMEAAVDMNTKADQLVRRAITIYETSLSKLHRLIAAAQIARTLRKPVAAQTIWQIGDLIFELKSNLAAITLEIDGLYEHLVRDLQVKRKWLEKVVIFRRYISDKGKIPPFLNWGRCEKGTRRVAEKIEKGISLD